MIKEAVYHKINSNYSYAPSSEYLVVIFRVAKNDMHGVSVHYYNRFAEKNIKRQEMQCIISDSLFDYYRAKLKLSGASCVYYFELIDKDGVTAYFSELGFIDVPPERIGSYEMLPIHKTEINPVPDWVARSVFYQIFPDRFCNSSDVASAYI